MYVAGFDLGVRPIGDWSMSIILSTSSVPLKPLNGFGIFLDLLLFKVRFKALYKVCKTRVDLPLPETPVTQVKLPSGIFKLTLSKLFPVAPVISKNLPFFFFFLFCGTLILNFFESYLPVILFLFWLSSLNVP